MEILEKIRACLREKGLSAIIIPSNDPHFGEYIPEHYALRAMVSGFTGSAGTLVVTLSKAALWTDSRYFEQAERELAGSSIELMKMKMPGVPSITSWISSELCDGDSVAIDGALFSVRERDSLKKDMPTLVLSVTGDIIGPLIENRPAVKYGPVAVMPEEIAGVPASSKRRQLSESLSSATDMSDACYFTQMCDEVAWLTNTRGNDIMYNPVFMSYCAVTEDKTVLFVNKGCVSPENERVLASQGIVLENYESIASYLGRFRKVVAALSRMSVSLYDKLVSEGIEVVDDPVPQGSVAMMKAVKNDVELEGFRKACHNDSIAWIRFLKYIDDNFRKGTLDEYALSEILQEIRAGVSHDYVGESFSPIVAYGANAALPHYEPEKDSSSQVLPDGFLLIDTGAQFIYGTTDTTRTLLLGDVPYEWKLDYALVLKGMVDLSMAVFPKGTRGAQLDILARGPIMTTGKMYMHGTGHGIGHYLNVHEGPQSIRIEDNPTPLLPGMVTSNEPAVYVPGKYGIRIENTVSCIAADSQGFGEFIRFDTLNHVPIELGFIKENSGLRGIFSDVEWKWLTDYNMMVYEQAASDLSLEERAWYERKYLI